jgi:hypothetical protein
MIMLPSAKATVKHPHSTQINIFKCTSIGSNVNTGINMAKRKNKHNLFLLSWDMTGLETVLDLTTLEKLRQDEEKHRIISILADPEGRDPGDQTGMALNRAVQGILLRARVNSQRHYEVYTIQTTPGITEQNMWDLFNNNPQHAADLIREHGNCLYSDRVNTRTQVIV